MVPLFQNALQPLMPDGLRSMGKFVVLGQRHEFRASPKLMLLQQMADVEFHGMNADRKLACDLGVCQPLGDEMNNCLVARAQFRKIGAVFSEGAQDIGRQGRRKIDSLVRQLTDGRRELGH